jgi:signal transduction histidine kinase/ligand-binding sensor domain-containing protein
MSTDDGSPGGLLGAPRRFRGDGCGARTGVVLFLLLGPLLAPAAAALDPERALTQYVHDSWRSEQGLPQNTGLSLARTGDGFLWVGTEEGIARFDGTTFVPFDRGNTRGIPHNLVYSLLGDADGSLWIGTAGGLAHLKEGKARTFGERENVPEKAVRCILQDRSGAVWAGTWGGGLVRIAKGAAKDSTVFSVFTTRDGLAGDEISSLLEDPDGTLWIATATGLSRRRPDGRIEPFTVPGTRDTRFRGLCRAKDGTFWIGSGAGLVRLKGGTGRRFGTEDGLSSERIHTLAADRDGNVWAATAAGLCRITGDSVSCFKEPGPSTPGPAFPILEDDAGDLWFGTAGGGLNRLRDAPFRVFGRPEGLPSDVVLAYCEARDGSVWIGTFGAGLALLRPGEVKRWSRNEGLPDDTVVSIHEDRDGVAWIATKGGLAAVKGTRVRPDLVPPGLPSGDLYGVTEDAEGTLWVASDAGLSWREGRRFRTLGTAEGLPSLRLRMMTATRDGSIWVGAAGGGLARVRDGKVATFDESSGLPRATFYALHEDADGTLWGGTLGGGLVRGRNGRFRSFTTRDGLLDDTVYEVVDDGLGRFWLTSNRGVSVVSRSDLDALEEGRIRTIPVELYGVAEGLRSGECNGAGEPSGFRSRDGRLWFATLGGAAVFDPRHRPPPSVPPATTVDQVIVDGRSVPIGSGVVVPAGPATLEIRYTAPVLRLPGRARFRYRLAGFDGQPIDAGPRRSAIYTNLPPGTYAFTASVSADHGLFGPPNPGLAIRVEPRLHQTWWFLALCVASALGGAWALHTVRIRLLRARARELEGLVADRTRSLLHEKERTEEANRVKSQFLANVTHDLRTPLNAIIGYTDLLREQADERSLPDFSDDLGRIRRAAEHQLALVNDVLDLAKVEAGRLDVEAVPLDLPGFLSEILATVRPVVRKHGNQLEAEGLGTMGTIRTDPTRLRQILLNLLSNAARHTTNGTVRLEAERASGEVVLRVRDTGVGLAEDEIAVLFQAFSQARGGDSRGGTGLGLDISRRLARLLGGDISVESEPGHGSTFTLRLPAGNA